MRRGSQGHLKVRKRVSIRSLLLLFLASQAGLVSSPSHATVIIRGNPFSAADSYGLSPYWNWRVIESKNFRIIFPEELKEAANRTVNYYEEAHEFLSPLLRWQPNYKTQVLLIDNRDVANGLTAPIGRFGMILWVTPPESGSGVSYYEDWLRLLVIHEYTHFLNMDATHGIWAPLRYLFGDALLPNSIWPPWMLEGLAVYMETRFTHAGRGRGPEYQMMIRAAAEHHLLNDRKFITLDKVNGDNPYYPKGDTRYQFGYQLMNQISRQKISGFTADGETPTTGGDDLLGILSARSGKRIPLFINGNLKNVAGKDWYELWEEWTQEAQTRAEAELKIIHSQPTTEFEYLTENEIQISNEVTGPKVSPDGKWLAYTLVSADRRQGLYLKNLKTGETRRLYDKLAGVGLAFTPDSKALISSELNRKGIYYLYSDLKIYHLENDSSYGLTRKLRARDPDISCDGKWVTFTIAEKSGVGLAIAPFIQKDNDYELGPVQKLIGPIPYDRVSNPRFSPDGKKIVFSYHKNGHSQEDLLEYDLSTQKVKTLISDGKYNGFPTYSPQGDLYFTSNLTGTDNLFRYVPNQNRGELVSNMTTGIGYPSFGPNSSKEFYASVFSYTGWNLAKVKLLDHPIQTASVTLPDPPAPPPSQHAEPHPPNVEYPTENYSPFPSILPRTWSPLLGAGSGGVSVGAQVIGFDAVNRHRYYLTGAYTTNFNVFDGYAVYSNRSLGPSIDFSADMFTMNVNSFSGGREYSRQADFTTSVAYPLLGTYSSLTPSVALNLQKVFNYQLLNGAPSSQFLGSTRLVPNIDALLTFSNEETSNLAISSEGGRFTRLGSRYYLDPDDPVWKLLFIDQEFIRIAKHSILVPSLKAMWSSHINRNYLSSSTVLSGRTLQQIVDPFESDNFNQLAIRGYAGRSYFTKAAMVAALDFRFPIARVFGGWGTNPLFVENLFGFVFGEASYLPYSANNTVLPSAGGGLRLSTEVLFFPVTLSLEFHQGFNQSLGGSSDVFFQLISPGLPF